MGPYEEENFTGQGKKGTSRPAGGEERKEFFYEDGGET